MKTVYMNGDVELLKMLLLFRKCPRDLGLKRKCEGFMEGLCRVYEGRLSSQQHSPDYISHEDEEGISG
jgi:hypothetical protein